MAPPASDQKSFEESLADKTITVEFSQENSRALRKIAASGRYGNTPTDVVIAALTLLWNIYTNHRDATTIVVGDTVIDIPDNR